MKPKDIFSLAIRLVGLFFICLAAVSAPVIWNSSGNGFFRAILVVGFFLAVAWWLLGGAPLLMQRAYPDETKDETAKPAPLGTKADA
jgi:hypothetical protein